jgi:hypothetical protein
MVERQAIGQGRGGDPGRWRDEGIDRAAIRPTGAGQPPHFPHAQHRLLDDGDAVISPQASVRLSAGGGIPLLLPNKLARDTMAVPYQQDYLPPLSPAVQNCTVEYPSCRDGRLA